MPARQKSTSPNSPLAARLKRNLKYGDTFLCIFPTWDTNRNEIVSRNKRHHKVVHCLHILHFLSIWTQLYCTRRKANNFLEAAEAVGFSVMILAGLLTESEIYPDDSGQIPFLNYICTYMENK